MAKIEIKTKNPDMEALTIRDLDITVDGVKISKLVSFSLDINYEEVNSCHISFLVDGVEVDAAALAYLNALVTNERRKGDDGPRTKA